MTISASSLTRCKPTCNSDQEVNVGSRLTLVCAFCAQGIEKKLRKLPATADVVVSLEQRLVAVSLKDGQDIPDADLRKALTNAGYTVTSIQRTDTPIDTVRARVKQAKP